MSTIRLATLALATLLLVSGCSATRFVYEQLDWFIVWRLNVFFNLDAGQEDELRRAVNDTLDWTRTTQLPRYAVVLRSVSQQVADELTPADLDRRYEEMVSLWNQWLRHVVPEAAGFLRQLRDEQIDDFMDNLEINNDELWDEYAGRTAEKRRERREKVTIKTAQRFAGRLNGEQKDLIRSYTAAMHDVSLEWIEGRRAWQAELRQLLLEKPPRAEYERRLERLFIDPNRGDTEDYRAKVEDNRQMALQMSAELLNALTDKQREILMGRLNKYARDFEALASRGSGAQ